ncbi:unnamed protein product [Phytophthora fragariaefolia]|uniref:Unnamed protein product n=1 Tax=Phytophthora fragariaefolia TaxID=1490495 RepID=A0A9W7D2U0_9STRA|nr:unnamed protein product [Phytophthora fragariaefolia]
MELFTLLSLVNNQAFEELIELSAPRLQAHAVVSPNWVVGPLSPKVPVGQDTMTWGALLGFPGDPFEQGFNSPADTLHSLQSLFDVFVPPIVLACATRGWASLTAVRKPPSLSDRPCNYVCAEVWNWAHPVVLELAKGFATTAINKFSLGLEGKTINSPTAMMNAGVLLNSLVCGQAVYEGIGRTSPNTFQLEYGRFVLSFVGVCDKLFTATCSAIAEMPVETPLSKLRMGLEGSRRWSWLAYALCGGASEAIIPSVDIVRGTLTKSDVQIMSTVLKTNYPQPILENGQNDSHQYGFVNIPEGTELHLCGVDDVDVGRFVMPSRCICRALYDPADGEWINIVVPGYGMCKEILGGSIQFVADAGKSIFQKKRLSTSLGIRSVIFETPTVLMDMLALVTSGLRELTLFARREDTMGRIDVDIYMLSIACPALHNLTVGIFNVVVSAYDEPLCHWPVKAIRLIQYTGRLSDLTRCLRSPAVRMSRELVSLEVLSDECKHAEKKELIALNGEFLPVIKEKFPAKSMAAVLSAVTSLIHPLDAFVLSLIFEFASTPMQRSIKYGWMCCSAIGRKKCRVRNGSQLPSAPHVRLVAVSPQAEAQQEHARGRARGRSGRQTVDGWQRRCSGRGGVDARSGRGSGGRGGALAAAAAALGERTPAAEAPQNAENRSAEDARGRSAADDEAPRERRSRRRSHAASWTGLERLQRALVFAAADVRAAEAAALQHGVQCGASVKVQRRGVGLDGTGGHLRRVDGQTRGAANDFRCRHGRRWTAETAFAFAVAFSRGPGIVRMVKTALLTPRCNEDPSADSELAGFVARVVDEPFDLAHQAPIRVYAFASPYHNSTSSWVLAVILHHIVTDATSSQLFWNDFHELYAHALHGDTATVSLALKLDTDASNGSRLSYRDFAVWQRSCMRSGIIASGVQYWTQQLTEGVVPQLLELPFDWNTAGAVNESPAKPSTLDTTTTEGDVVIFRSSPALQKAFSALCQAQGASMFMGLLAVFYLLVERLSGQHDFVIGAPSSGRGRTELQDIMGYFVNTLPLRLGAKCNGDEDFTAFLASVREVVLGAYTHMDIPFHKVLDHLRATTRSNRDMGTGDIEQRWQHPLFQIMFSWESVDDTTGGNSSSSKYTELSLPHRSAKFDLMLSMRYRHLEGGTANHVLEGTMEYPTARFARDTVERFTRYYLTLLEQVTDAPTSVVRSPSISMLSESERRQLVFEWGTPKPPASPSIPNEKPSWDFLDKCLLAQVHKTPHRPALYFEDVQWTYRDLSEQIGHVTEALSMLNLTGYAGELHIGLLLDRGLENVAAMVATLCLKGVFVPLDPEFPRERLRYMAHDSQLQVIITQRKHYEVASYLSARGSEENVGRSPRVLYYEDIDALTLRYEFPHKNRMQFQCPDSLDPHRTTAYILYTSGSTGNPKGVEVSHAALMTTLWWTVRTYEVTPDDVFLQSTSTTLDGSLSQLFSPLLVGGSARITRPKGLHELHYVRDVLLEAPHITFCVFVPSYFALIVDYLSENGDSFPTSVKHVVLAGEAFPTELARQFYRKHGDTTACLVNEYGPTEASITSTAFRPVDEHPVIVLDTHQRLVPVNVPGELFIGGAGVARGYWRRSDLTSQTFIPHKDLHQIAYADRKRGLRCCRKFVMCCCATRPSGPLEEYLRCFVDPLQDDWDIHLANAEFAVNSTVNSSTKLAPFEADLGYVPLNPLQLAAEQLEQVPKSRRGTEFREHQAAILLRCRETLAQAQERMRDIYDRNRVEQVFDVGDRVYLSTQHLDKLHPVFNTSSLKPYNEPSR